MDGCLGDVTALFEPAAGRLKDRGVTIADAAVEPDGRNPVTLPVTNHSLKPVLLGKDELLGSLQPVTVTPLSESASKSLVCEQVVAHLHPTKCMGQRGTKRD